MDTYPAYLFGKELLYDRTAGNGDMPTVSEETLIVVVPALIPKDGPEYYIGVPSQFDWTEPVMWAELHPYVPLDPSQNQVWAHKNGNRYHPIMLANMATSDPNGQFKPTVVYESMLDGKIWSRPLADWHRSFKFLGNMSAFGVDLVDWLPSGKPSFEAVDNITRL